MCGGGGGDDGGATLREHERQKRMDKATATIDNLFGIQREKVVRDYPISHYEVKAPPVTTAPTFDDEGNQLKPNEEVNYSPVYVEGPSFDDGYDRSLADKNAGLREGLYGDVRKNTIDHFMRDLVDQQKIAGRTRNFSLADRGLTGGSVDVDTGAELQDRFNRGVIDVTNRGDAASNDMRAADSASRQNLLGKIQAGADASVAQNSALAELNNNALTSRSKATGQQLSDFFGDVLFLQRAKNNFVNGQQVQQQAQSYYPSRPSTSGSQGIISK